MSWEYSLVMIAEAGDAAELNRLAERLGHGPDNLSVRLSADGAEPATHLGGRAWARAAFLRLLEDMGAGSLPAELEGEDAGAVAALLGRCVMAGAVDAEGPRAHWEAALSAAGLLETGNTGGEA